MNQKTLVSIRVSGRHCHLSREDLDILFGKDHELTSIKKVDQPGQFACKETITIKSEQGEIKNLRIVGPERGKSQVEISKTDAYQLKVNPPIKASVMAKGEKPLEIEMIGPKGSIKRNALIIAQRHLHLSTTQAKDLNLADQEIIKLRVSGLRALIFENVLVRVSDKYLKAVHIDTDEANAANIEKEAEAEILIT